MKFSCSSSRILLPTSSACTCNTAQHGRDHLGFFLIIHSVPLPQRGTFGAAKPAPERARSPLNQNCIHPPAVSLQRIREETLDMQVIACKKKTHLESVQEKNTDCMWSLMGLQESDVNLQKNTFSAQSLLGLIVNDRESRSRWATA